MAEGGLRTHADRKLMPNIDDDGWQVAQMDQRAERRIKPVRRQDQLPDDRSGVEVIATTQTTENSRGAHRRSRSLTAMINICAMVTSAIRTAKG